MSRKRFNDAIQNRSTSQPITPAENVANAMYGGQVDSDALGDFFDSLAQANSGGNLPMRLKVGDVGDIQIGNFRILSTGLQIADGVDESEWLAFGQHLRMMETSIQWIIGDWLAYGERAYGKTYQDVADQTGYTYETLRNLAWVSRQFELSYRYDKLSHTHHQKALLACNGDADIANSWLQRASDNGWSVKRMLDEMTGVPPTPPPHDTKIPKFWADMATFLSKQRKLAGRVGEDERQEMIRGLRVLIDEIEKIGNEGKKKR